MMSHIVSHPGLLPAQEHNKGAVPRGTAPLPLRVTDQKLNDPSTPNVRVLRSAAKNERGAPFS